MKGFRKYLKNLSYIPKVLLFLWSKDKLFVISLLFEAFFLSAEPFPRILLVKYTVDIISENVNFSYYTKIVVILLLIITAISVLKSLFNSKISRSRMFNISSKIANEFYSKSMTCDYENLFENEYLNKRELAKMFIQGGFSRLTSDIINLISLTNTVLFSMYMLRSIDIFSIFIIFISVFIQNKILLKKVESNRKITDEIGIKYRRYYFFSDASSEQKNFKEIKLFRWDKILDYEVDVGFREILKLNQKSLKNNCKYSMKQNIIELCITFIIYILVTVNIIYFNKPIGYSVVAINIVDIFKITLSRVSTQFGNYIDNIKCMEHYIEYINLVNNNDNVPILSDCKDSTESDNDIDAFAINKIEFRDVCFHYSEHKEYALKHVNVTIQAGDCIALIGVNGAGKTTFLKLLMGLYKATSGEILINDININELEPTSYRRHISSIFQDFYIFSFTIRENICTLLENVDYNRLNDCIEKAALKNIFNLPHGADTYIKKIYAQDGIELSGGEMQKLAFARAIYKDTAKLLIFDEPTSALDPMSEFNLYQMYRKVIKNNISFFVSHRLSCVNLCNKIIMFEDGNLTAFGTHQELMENNIEYRNMYEVQSKLYT